MCLGRGLIYSRANAQIGMFSRIKELRVQVNLNTKLIQEGVFMVCCGPFVQTGQLVGIY